MATRDRKPLLDTSLSLGRPPNLPRRRREPADVELADIQGNVLRGYSYPVAAYIFLRIDDVAKGKALLARMLDRITTGEPWEGDGPPTAIQLAFTYDGLKRARRPAGDARHVPGGVPRGDGGAGAPARRPRPGRAGAVGGRASAPARRTSSSASGRSTTRTSTRCARSCARSVRRRAPRR